MQQLDEVKEIQETIGAYDIIVKIESKTWEYLDKLLFEKIRMIPDIGNVIILHCNKKWE